MSFQQGLSGLNAAARNLDVIGNNVANAGVVGFRSSQAQFGDVFANSLAGSGASQIGIGVQLRSVAQQFSQGNISVTNNPLDIAINGNGFYRLSQNGAISYSRNGQFHSDSAGYIVNSDNLRLTGYTADATGNIVATSPVDLRIPTTDIAPSATTTFTSGLNVDARSGVLLPASFSALNPATYTSSTSGTVFDSLGNSHVFTLYFLKSASNAWNTYATIDGAATAGGVPIGVTIGGGGALTFNSSGALTAPAAPVTVAVDLAAVATALGTVNGATTPFNFTLDLSRTTQFGAGFSVNTLSQNGFSSGRLSGFNVGGDGIIQGQYSNGQTKRLGQVVLADFNNPQGLSPLGGNLWQETSDSGLPVVGTPGSGRLGALQAAAVEDSNVDLTTELVNMITAQRVYQANAQTIKIQDAMLQTLVNLR